MKIYIRKTLILTVALTIIMASFPAISPMQCFAEGVIDIPAKAQPVISANRKLEANRLLTSGGIKAGSKLSLEPTFGLSHISRQTDIGSGTDSTLHKIDAQAGGKVNLYDRFYLGVSTKLPVYDFEMTSDRTVGGHSLFPNSSRQEYDFMHPNPSNLRWTGEIGYHLGKRLDLNLYYDQSLIKTPSVSGGSNDEEIIGTRLLFRFK